MLDAGVALSHTSCVFSLLVSLVSLVRLVCFVRLLPLLRCLCRFLIVVEAMYGWITEPAALTRSIAVHIATWRNV